MRHWIGWAVIVALLTGCAENKTSSSSSKPTTSNPPKKLRIAVIPKGTSHIFWKSVHAGAELAAKELGDVDIIWKGPLLENDRDTQMNVVQDFITAKVDGICLAPLDKQALIGPVKESVEAGIPIVIFDSALQDESIIASYVATDNRKGGELAARHMAHILESHGNVIMLRYNTGSESTEQREEGFLDTLKAEFPEIKILSSDEYAGTTPELSLDKATQVLGKYRSSVNGIFAVCEPNANGILIALKETQLAGKVKFICFDPSEDLIRAMSDGTCHGIVLQDPITMGYQAVKSIVKAIRKEPVEKRIGTGEFLATPENMKTPEMEKLLNPDRI
jgi:ribose transport system substrate-binding protein